MNKVELSPLYISQSFADKIPIQEVLYRYDVQGSRMYRRKTGEFYRSLTTFISLVESNPVFLNTWREDLIEELGSGEKVDQFVEATASYGTTVHEAMAIIAREGGVDWDQLATWSRSELSGLGLSGKPLSKAVADVINDVACFMTFIHEYRVNILVVELPVYHSSGIATLIDLVIEKDLKKYVSTPVEKRQRHRCIVNIKTGRKGSFEAHTLQLRGEMLMFNELYGPKFGEILDVYNLAPTAWKSTPDYKLTNQRENLEKNDGELIKVFDNYLDRAKIRGYLKTPRTKFRKFKGITKIGDSPVDQLFFQEYGQFVEDDKNFETTKDINSEK